MTLFKRLREADAHLLRPAENEIKRPVEWKASDSRLKSDAAKCVSGNFEQPKCDERWSCLPAGSKPSIKAAMRATMET
jgi:hypothetical protein